MAIDIAEAEMLPVFLSWKSTLRWSDERDQFSFRLVSDPTGKTFLVEAVDLQPGAISRNTSVAYMLCEQACCMGYVFAAC